MFLDAFFVVGEQKQPLSQNTECMVYLPTFHSGATSLSFVTVNFLHISANCPTHTIYVWYIQLHLVDFHGKCR